MMQRVLRSSTISTWASFLVRSLTLIAVIPLALRRLSPEEGVVWQSFSMLTMVLSMADFGLSPTFVRLLSYAHGQEDEMQSIRLERAMQWLQDRAVWIGGSILLVVGSGLLIRPISRCGDPWEGWFAWAGVFVGSLFLFRSSLFGAVLQGRQKVADWRWLEMFASIGGVACTLLVLISGKGLMYLSFAGQVPGLLLLFVGRRLARKPEHSTVELDEETVRQTVRDAWGPSWRSGLGVMMNQGLYLVSPLVFAQIAPAAAVASYMVASRLMAAVSQFSQAPFYSKIPSLASLYGQRMGGELVNRAGSAMVKVLFLFVVGAVSAGIVYPMLLRMWGSQTEFVPMWVWAILLLASLLERMGAMLLQFHSLSNVIRWHIANGGAACVFLVLVLLLGHWYSVMAIPMALLGANLLFYLPYSFFLARAVRKDISLWPSHKGDA